MLASIAGLAPSELAAARAGFPPELAKELPPSFALMLEAAVAQERRDGSERADQLVHHYFTAMPAMRADQLDPGRAPQSVFFHTPLDLERMPRLAGGLARLHALLERCGVPSTGPDALVARFPTLAALYRETYYGGFMPLLYGYPADLALFARDLSRDEPHVVIDRHLTAPIIHELTHLGRRRSALLPLYLDECIAAHLGVTVLPELAFPAPGEANGLYATPWFSQVGHALARVVGLGPLVRAHAGVIAWAAVLSTGFMEAAIRLGWEDYLERRGPHFLSDNFQPDPWLKLVYLGEPRTRVELEAVPWSALPVPAESDDDEALIADALRAMCLESFQDELSFRVRTRAPAAELAIDLAGCRVTVASEVRNPFDPPRLAHHLPPAWCRRRARETGSDVISLKIDDPGTIPDLAGVLRRG